jgi:hypothetical protein
MPITVKKIILWRSEVDNKPGALASTIELPAKAVADLKVIMGYRHSAAEGKAAVEVFPIAGKKLAAAAGAAGLGPATSPTLLVEGDNKPGLGYAIAQNNNCRRNQYRLLCRAGDRGKACRSHRFRDGRRRKEGCTADQEGREEYGGLTLPDSSSG